MKRITLLILATAISFSLFSQEEDFSKHSFSWSAGLSLPLGSFKDDATKTGFGWNLNYNYRFHKYWAASFEFGQAFNGIDENEMGVTSAGAWSPSFLMSGFVLKLPSDKFTLNFRLMGGLMFVTTPEIFAYYTDGDYFLINETFTTAVPLKIGAGFEYSFNEKSALCVNVDFMFSNIEYNTTVEYLLFGDYYISNENIEVNYSVLSFSVGYVRYF